MIRSVVIVLELVSRIIMSHALCKHGPQCTVNKCGFAHSIEKLVPLQELQCMRQDYSQAPWLALLALIYFLARNSQENNSMSMLHQCG